MIIIMGRETTLHPNPTVQISSRNNPTDNIHNIFFDEHEMAAYDNVGEYDDDAVPMDAFACDYFRMYEFKVTRCARARSHDWVDCPYAHPGEKARRRDPRKFHYCGHPCQEFRKRTCGKGDTCEFAHGVFECWLHPSRYRTQPCKDGDRCRRRICFFAHTPEQLRFPPVSQLGESPSRLTFDSVVGKSSFTSSPPVSPAALTGQNSVNELISSVRDMRIGNTARLMSPSQSPINRVGFTSLSLTPTRVDRFDQWDGGSGREGRIMERVESGKEIRARIYAKLCRENSLTG